MLPNIYANFARAFATIVILNLVTLTTPIPTSEQVNTHFIQL